MGIIEFFVIAAFIGFLAWAITTLIPMPGQIARVIVIAAVIVIVLVLMRALGLLGHDVPIPHIG